MRFRSYLFVILCLLSPSLLHAHGQKSDDKDLAEVRSYVLTMDNVTRVYMVMYQMKQAAEKDPNLQKSMGDESEGDKGSQSVSSVAAKLSAYPTLVAIIANNGFTPHVFVVAEFAVIQSSLAAAAVKMGAPRDKMIADGSVSAANLNFVEQHHAELEELGKKYPMQ